MKNKKYIGFAFCLIFLLLAFSLWHHEPSSATGGVNGYADLVEAGRIANKISPDMPRETLSQKKSWILAGNDAVRKMEEALDKDCYVQDDLRPSSAPEHGIDTLRHFKRLSIVLVSGCQVGTVEQNAEEVIKNAVRLIRLGLAIGRGGDRDDQTAGFAFVQQGCHLGYQILKIHPKNIDDSLSVELMKFKDSIEPGSVTVERLGSGQFPSTSIKNRALEIQDNRIKVAGVCLDLFRIGIALELYHGNYGIYPESLTLLKMSDLPVDPWSGKEYQYKNNRNSFTLYSVGPDGIDDNGKTQQTAVIEEGGGGDIDLGAM